MLTCLSTITSAYGQGPKITIQDISYRGESIGFGDCDYDWFVENSSRELQGDIEILECIDYTPTNQPRRVGYIRGIDQYAFSGREQIVSLTLPQSIRTIGETFALCTSLNKMTIMALTPPTVENGFDFGGRNVDLWVPYYAYEYYISNSTYANSFHSINRLNYDLINNNILVVYYFRYDDREVDSEYDENYRYVHRVCAITSKDNSGNGSYSGNIVIPERAIRGGKKYYNGQIWHSFINEYELYDGEDVAIIASEAFKNCTELTSVNMPSIQIIDEKAFMNCTNLTTLDMPRVWKIGNRAFSGCSNLVNIHLSTKIETLGVNLFEGCTSLTNIYCEAIEPPTCNSSFSSLSNSVKFWVPYSSYSAYLSNPNYKNVNICRLPYDFEKDDIYYRFAEGGVEVVCKDENNGSYTGQEVEIPEYVYFNKIKYDVIGIGEKAFYRSGYSSLSWPNTIKYIGNSAFYGSRFNRDSFPGIISIGVNAFAHCVNMTKFTLSEGITFIPPAAFQGCSNLKTVTIQGDVTEIASNAFNGCEKLAKITLPDSLKKIGIASFKDCAALTSINIPFGTTSIGDQAFDGCTSLQSLDIYALQPPTIGAYTFTPALKQNITLTVPYTNAQYYQHEDAVTGVGANWEFTASNIIRRNYDFIVDGLYYRLGTKPGEVSLCSETAEGGNELFTGDYTVPEKVTYKGEEYKVTGISENTFKNCANLTSVSLPSCITSVGSYAFANCSNLTNVTNTGLLTSIGSHAFENCSKLTTFEFNDFLKVLNDGTFYGCVGFTSITLPNSLTTIGENVFSGCNAITTVTVKAITPPTMASSAFSNTTYTNATLIVPNSAQSDYQSATGWSQFTHKQSMTHDFSIDGIYYTLTGNGTVGVSGVVDDTYITVPETVTWSNTAYTVTSIGDNACCGLIELQEITLPNTITSIGYAAFEGCNISTINLAEGLIHIGAYAFAGCRFEEVTLPSTLTTLGAYAFYNQTRPITSITSYTLLPPVTGENAFGGNTPSNATVTVTPYSLTAYQKDENWKGFTNWEILNYDICYDGIYYLVEEENTSDVELFLCVTSKDKNYNSYSGTITIPHYIESIYGREGFVVNIGVGAFKNCTNLTRVEMRQVLNIGAMAFQNCTALTRLDIDFGSCESIGAMAFAGCSALQTINLGTTCKRIDALAFQDCSALKSIEIPASCISIGTMAFTGCSALTSVNSQPMTPPVIESNTFDKTTYSKALLSVTRSAVDTYAAATGWSSFTKVKRLNYDFCKWGVYYIINSNDSTVTATYKQWGYTIDYGDGTGEAHPDESYNDCAGNIDMRATVENEGKEYTVTAISDYAFRACEGLTSITIAPTVTSIGMGAFSGCTGLTSAKIWSQQLTMGDYAFNNCNHLTTLILPDGLTEIGNNSFMSCSALTSITIPEMVRTIGDNAFANCTDLNTVVISDAVRTIGESSFSNCTSLTNVTIGNMVESIGDYAFAQSPLRYVTCLPSVPPTINVNVFNQDTYDAAELYVSEFSMNDYQQAVGWSNFVEKVWSDYNVKVDGIYYVLDTNNATASVWKADQTSGMVTIPETIYFNDVEYTVTGIGGSAFSGSGISSILLPKTITTIGNSAFHDCSSLTKIYLLATNPPTTTNSFNSYSPTLYLFESAMSNYTGSPWSSFTKVALSFDFEKDGIFYKINGTKTVEVAEYPWTDNYSGSMTIPSLVENEGTTYTVSAIGIRAFYDSYITDVSIPSSVETIGANAFRKNEISNVDIPNSVTSIGVGAFMECTRLKEVVIGSSMTTIGESAFNGCTSVCDIICKAPIPPAINSYTFTNYDAVLHVPEGSLEAYQNADYWKNFLNIAAISRGDVNGDGETDVADFIAIANYILGTMPENFDEAAADVDSDGSIDVADFIAVANIILTTSEGAASAKAFAPATVASWEPTDITALDDVIYVESVNAEAGQEVTLSVKMNNQEAMQGYQFDLYLPEGMTIARDEDGMQKLEMSTERTTKRKTDYFDTTMQPDGALRVLCGSSKGNAFAGMDGEVARITVTISKEMQEGSYPIILRRVKMTDTDATLYPVAEDVVTMLQVGNVTGVTTPSDFSTREGAADAIYDLQGRKMNSEIDSHLSKGIYIINGKKIVVK